jgi:redox-sensing transcriptional repressor
MDMERVNERTIKRFLQYRNSLEKFKQLGFEKVFSYTLGEDSGVTAEQVRKDFSIFGIKGNKKSGYTINSLIKSIDVIFKKTEDRSAIIVGMGNIGKALTNYKGFPENNLTIEAAFDLDPAKQGKKFKVPVYPIQELGTIIKKINAKVAIIAVPDIAAQEVCDMLVAYGIKGILNFSPILLQVPENVVVNNVNLRNELAFLFYYT